MRLTVCICTHNRPRYVRDCLAGLRQQTVQAFETLIVDSASGPGTRAALAAICHGDPGLRLIRLEEPGISIARDAGAAATVTPYIAYIDDDAIPASDWVEAILRALRSSPQNPALVGGRILPLWEAPLPAWWPATLRGILSIIEHEGSGEYRTDAVPHGLEPYAANMVVHVESLRAAGGFGRDTGRIGKVLLSDEEVRLAWRLQDAGQLVRYDSSITVYHQIHAARLNPSWLLSRLYWQGASTVQTRRHLGYDRAVWRELPRRLAVAVLCAPAALLPAGSTWCLAARWRWSYAAGFIRAAFGWRAGDAAQRIAASSL